MSDDTGTDAGEAVDGLISRLTVIDQQPLGGRATAFAQIHDELRVVLEGSGSSGTGSSGTGSSISGPSPR